MRQISTLCIIHQDNRLLLGMKKRGFGRGRWNGFGGKVESGETIEEAAERETYEEANIRVLDLHKIGMLEFFWKNKQRQLLEVHIFKSLAFDGNLEETEEMRPQWFDTRQLPYHEMWSDDSHWMPLFLSSQSFTGKFLFDDKDQILDYNLNRLKV